MPQLTPYDAPNFELVGSDGQLYKLTDYRGRWLVIYFYPKDDTPGCTAQACSIRDEEKALLESGVTVMGISADDELSHRKFIAKYNLNFILLSDPQKQAIEAYGAWGKKMFGREGILRKTFIINPEGKVVKVYGRAQTVGHGVQLLNDLKLLQA
ncbi:MAG: peroxiredoxin [Candidatus Saccharibacteria bacterium]|nr:peroxiredoxin [Candidatus Saccharibacteria bacterium]